MSTTNKNNIILDANGKCYLCSINNNKRIYFKKLPTGNNNNIFIKNWFLINKDIRILIIKYVFGNLSGFNKIKAIEKTLRYGIFCIFEIIKTLESYELKMFITHFMIHMDVKMILEFLQECYNQRILSLEIQDYIFIHFSGYYHYQNFNYKEYLNYNGPEKPEHNIILNIVSIFNNADQEKIKTGLINLFNNIQIYSLTHSNAILYSIKKYFGYDFTNTKHIENTIKTAINTNDKDLLNSNIPFNCQRCLIINYYNSVPEYRDYFIECLKKDLIIRTDAFSLLYVKSYTDDDIELTNIFTDKYMNVLKFLAGYKPLSNEPSIK